jgi:YD repeat-containing protein
MTLLKHTQELQMTGLVKKMNSSKWIAASIIGMSALILQSVSYAAVGDLVQTMTSTNSYDEIGNVTVVDVSTTVNEPNGAGGIVAKTYTKKTINSYSNIDAANWRLGWINCSLSWGSMPSDSNLTSTDIISAMASSYTYNTTGVNTGQLQNKVIGPAAATASAPAVCSAPLAASAITTAYSYNNVGNVLSQTISGADFASRTTSSTYDTTGRFVKTNTNALNQTENLDYYYDKGLLKSQTGPNGLTTAWEYDGIGRKKKETRPDGTYTLITYSNCDATCDASANEQYKITTANYRANGTLIDAANTSFYDQLNRLLRSTTTSFDNKTLVVGKKVYNALGKVVETYANHNLPLVSGDSLVNYKTALNYDAFGRPLQTTEASGRTSKVSYDSSFTTTTTIYPTTDTTTGGQKKTENKNGLGRLVEVVDNANNSLKYVYDIKGNLRKTIDAKNNVIEMQYNLLGQKTKMIDPDMGEWNYTYDLLGELLTQIDANLKSTTMTYDKLGRILTRLESDLNSTWVYDTATKGIGQLASVSSTNGFSRSYTYDSLGRPSTSTTTVDNKTYSVNNAYDDAGRASTFTYPITGVGYTNIYDSNGYLKEVQDKTTPTTVY